MNKLTASDTEFFGSAIRQVSLEQLDSNSAIKQISLEQLDSKPEQEEDSEILELAEIWMKEWGQWSFDDLLYLKLANDRSVSQKEHRQGRKIASVA